MPVSILVTGGTGNIGTWATRWLAANGYRPVAYDLRPDLTYLKDIADKIEVVTGDVTDLAKLNDVIKQYKIARVLHLAKLLGRGCEENPRRAVEVNVLGTTNVIEAARTNGIRRIVFSSSKSVYASITGKYGYPTFTPMKEDFPKFDREESSFVPFYSTTNKMTEYIGIRIAMKYDLEFVILRFGPVWGPGKMAGQLKYKETEKFTAAFVLSKMVDDVIEGKPTNLAEGGNPRDADNFVYNKDVGQGCARACVSDNIKFKDNHRDIHFDAARVYTLADFVPALKKLFPKVQVSVGDRMIEMPRNRLDTKGVFDISRAREEIGYEPEFADPTKAIADYIETEKSLKK